MRNAAFVSLLLAGSALAGLAQAASIALPGSGQPQWWLQLLSLALLVYLLDRSSGRWQPLLAGWLFAIAWLASTFWWLYVSMHVYGGLSPLLAAAGVLALAVFLGAYYALACLAYRTLAPRRGLMRLLVFAACWLLAELARGQLFTGFPWGGSGYAHVQGPLAALAPWAGVYGISALAALAAAALAQLLPGMKEATNCVRTIPLRPQPWMGAAVVALVLGAAFALTLWQQRGAAPWLGRDHGAPLQVALLQGNIPQDEKFHAGTGISEALQWYGQQWMSLDDSLVIAPETAIPEFVQHLPEGYLEAVLLRRYDPQWAASREPEQMEEPAAEESTAGGEAPDDAAQQPSPPQRPPQAVLTGIPLELSAQSYTNSVIGIQPGQGMSYRYSKSHLVPFGEFIPPLLRWFTDMMNIPLGDFTRGERNQPSFSWQQQQLAPNICYEDLFGEELAARFDGAYAAPTIFVNVSNIGWFGNTVAIDQHLAISRMRALEFARPVVRATNTGATAIINHRGQVVAELPRFTRDVLHGEVQGRSGLTPYARWVSVTGLWPLWALALVIVVLPLLTRQRWRAR